MSDDYNVKIITTLKDITPAAWNILGGDHDPFLSHEYLYAMEKHGCVGSEFGWFPSYITVENLYGKIVGATPAYIKNNSYGELVFDWSWASAYKRAGLRYYPKLVCAVPYTPATGSRLMAYPAHADKLLIKQLLIRGAVTYAKQRDLSSVHWLFPNQSDINVLHEQGLIPRMDCQYHWSNQKYTDFDHFLSTLKSSRRKKIKAERRKAHQAGFEFVNKNGDEIEAQEWDAIHALYQDTFDKKAGIPTLSRGFFADSGKALGERFMVVLVKNNLDIVACAIYYQSDKTLYGRYWGAKVHADGLHFETCFYQGIEYCINQGIQYFEPGAQGEHKIWRGFVPTPTYSFHWVENSAFSGVINDYCDQEQEMMKKQCLELTEHVPYREDAMPVRFGLSLPE